MHPLSKPQHSLFLVLIIPLLILIILLLILIIHIPQSRSNPHYSHSYPHQSLILKLRKSPILYCTYLRYISNTLCSFSHVPRSTFLLIIIHVFSGKLNFFTLTFFKNIYVDKAITITKQHPFLFVINSSMRL
jgi:hypothetical protein